MNMRRIGMPLAFTLASVAAWSGPVAAQSGGAPSQEDSFTKLALHEGIAPIGKMGGFSGTVDATGHRILAENLSVVQPVSVLVIATDAARPIRADLVKGSWDEPLRSGTTDASGRVVFNTRTEGNMGILVRSADGQPASYKLAVWVGDETPGEPASIFTATRSTTRSDGGDASPGAAARGGSVAWVGAAGVLALLLAGAFVMRRRSRAQKQSAIVLCLLVVPLSLGAQGKPGPWTEGLGEQLQKGMKGANDFIQKKLLDPKNWNPDEWKETFEPLAPEDKAYDENYDPPGMPELPLQCAESEECADCFEPAYERLKKVRIRFEKLRRIYEWTKAYKDRAFALGDSAAGIHGLAGLAWVGERVKLERQYKQFEASYDAKYEELVAELRGALDQIAACEEKVYGEEGWYNRYGFIYYQFMADRYRRS